jgi:hypothetical protein
MTTHHLTIETHGICTHFTHGVVSGVPHRIVLPNATHIQTQTIAVGNGSPVLYYLVPHFPQLEVPGGPDLTIADVLRHGDVLMGARLQVINCINRRIEYMDDEAPHLSDYDPDYTISDDVVLQGRAACYLDVYGGVVTYHLPPRPNGAGFISITMQTDGPPELLVTPLAQWTEPGPEAHRVCLGESTDAASPVTLKVRNVELARELDADESFGAFDFLLHYLTARGGIPASIVKPAPGMRDDPKPVEPARMAKALNELAKNLLDAANTADTKRDLLHEQFLTASCAPTQYP